MSKVPNLLWLIIISLVMSLQIQSPCLAANNKKTRRIEDFRNDDRQILERGKISPTRHSLGAL